jgi:Tol biopolymer transport system component
VSRIVFTQGGKIWVADPNGRHRRFLTRGSSPVISPDGHWVVFQRNCFDTGCLYLVDAAGGAAGILAREVDQPVWAPDSRHLAALGSTPEPFFDDQLVTVDRITGKRYWIAVAPSILGFDFSPDGKRLAFALGRFPGEQSDVYVSVMDGGALRRLTWDDRSSYPVWTPDGKIVFWHREGPLGPFYHDQVWGKHRLWKMLPNGREREVLTARLRPAITDERLGLRAVAWSRDGNTLLAVSPTHNGEYVYVVTVGGSIRSLGDHGYLGYASALDISRDGRFVLVWDQLDGPDSRRTRVELVPTDGGPIRMIARNVGPPSWSR